MTKQQAISLKLAQWLGWDERIGESGCGYYVCIDAQKEFVQFNPFLSTTEGRAQFAECVIKAVSSGVSVHMVKHSIMCGWMMTPDGQAPHKNEPESIVAATLEAIYYAIGGTDTWSEK